MEIHEEIEKELRLSGSETAVVHGRIVGDVFTRGSSTFILHGIVKGNIWIEDNASVFIHGMVAGDVTNNGGTLRHYGMIKGNLHKLSGQTIVHPRAVICESKC
jgi:cytoskeletal protein CcmA (bactofilin family)